MKAQPATSGYASVPTCSHSDMAMRASSVEIGAIARDLHAVAARASELACYSNVEN
jgi:hypothetical protein